MIIFNKLRFFRILFLTLRFNRYMISMSKGSEHMKLTLKALRVNYGLTQAEIAKIVGVSPDTWSNYERAKTFPNKKTLDNIEKYFGANYNDLIFYRNLRFNRNLIK